MRKYTSCWSRIVTHCSGNITILPLTQTVHFIFARIFWFFWSATNGVYNLLIYKKLNFMQAQPIGKGLILTQAEQMQTKGFGFLLLNCSCYRRSYLVNMFGKSPGKATSHLDSNFTIINSYIYLNFFATSEDLRHINNLLIGIYGVSYKYEWLISPCIGRKKFRS